MKLMVRVTCFLLCLGLFVLCSQAQSTISKIIFNSPPISEIPKCVTRPSSIGNSIFFEVVVPSTLKPEVTGAQVGWELANDNIVFQFPLKDSDGNTYKGGKCVASLKEFTITLTAASPPTAGSTSDANSSATQPTLSSAPTPVPNPPTPSVSNKSNDEVQEQALDLSIPESPGFTILGLTPQEVTRPATPREFATAIINSIDRDGNFQSGIAIDTAPFQLLFGKRVSADEYRSFRDEDTNKREPGAFNRYLTRFFWRTQFSIATTKGTTESDKSARIGTGLNMIFFDNGDVNLDEVFYDCRQALNLELINQSYRDTGVDRTNTNPDEVRRVLAYRIALSNSDAYLKRYEKCAEDTKKRNFGKSSFGVGVAGSWISTSGESSKFTNNGQGLWASLTYGFENIHGVRCTEEEILDEKNRCITPQLIFHFRRRVKETVPDPLLEGIFTTRDSNLFGMRLRVGVPKWSLNFEGLYQAARYAGRTSSSNIQASFGADYQLAKNLYLNFSIGGETKESNIPNTGKVFVRTSFNWGTSQKPLQD